MKGSKRRPPPRTHRVIPENEEAVRIARDNLRSFAELMAKMEEELSREERSLRERFNDPT